MVKTKKAALVQPLCVACGSCIQACSMGAICIPAGIIAKVDLKKCVGCGKCSKICPAGVIELVLREEEK